VNLEIRKLTSPDVTPYAWTPDSRDDVYFLVELEIGTKGAVGADIFQVMVATPEGLRKHARGGVLSERACLLLSDFSSWRDLSAHLQAIVDRCSVGDVVQSTDRLQRYFQWEYEDYGAPR
jgi:hypothetical protein